MRIVVTLNPFGKTSQAPLDELCKLSRLHEIIMHPMGAHRMTITETEEMLDRYDPEIIIADTEVYDSKLLTKTGKSLKMISRGGIGVDSVDLQYCKEHNIVVTNTPDAPSDAVAELTICQMINMLRKVREVDAMLVKGNWNRYIGRELSECIVGVIGCGRIGTRVIHRLAPFGCTMIITDINTGACFNDGIKAKQVYTDNLIGLYSQCDIITIHIPLIDTVENGIDNHDFITMKYLKLMKKDVRLLNLSRGGIINEEDLYQWLQQNKKATVALDSFKEEAYRGKLRELHNAYLTPHLGSCTIKSRNAMELGAVKNAILFINKEKMENRVV